MSVTLEIITVPKIVRTFLGHTSVCATLGMSSRRMATAVQVRRVNATINTYIQFLLVDIDECQLGYCNHFCNNSIGSFICSCQDGYALENDNRICMGEAFDLSFVPNLIPYYRY